MKRIIIMGYAGHGKDTVSEIIADRLNITFESSSHFVFSKAVYPTISERHGYTSKVECYAMRHKHREEFFNLIRAYNGNDLSRIGRELFEVHSIYCGIRNIDELNEIKYKLNPELIIWVDASKRLPPEPAASCSVGPDDADIILNNNGSKFDLIMRIDKMLAALRPEEVAK